MKQIYSDFSGGLTLNDRQGENNQFYIGRDVDIYRVKGCLVNARAPYNITIANTDFLDITPDITPNQAQSFAFGNNGRIYKIKSIDATPVIDTTFNSIGYDTVTDMTYAKGINYTISGTNYLMWVYKTLGRGVLGLASTASWTPTKVYKALSSGSHLGEADIIEWQKNLWITSGRYLDKYIGSSDTLTEGAFDLGDGWSSTCLFTTQNYLGTFATKKGVVLATTSTLNYECRVYLIDDSSATDAVTIIPLSGINKVYACVNINGNIYFLADGRKSAHLLCQLTDNGYKIVRNLEGDINEVFTKFSVPPFASGIAVNFNKIFFGIGNYVMVFCYDPEKDILTLISTPNTIDATIRQGYVSTIKPFTRNSMFVSYYDSATKKLCALPFEGDPAYEPSNSTNANWKPPYKDFGQKVILNYIKVYFRPLISGDIGTVSINTNYGTSNTIQPNGGVISQAIDDPSVVGKVTSKKFDLGGIECDSFRPSISWNAGIATITRVIIDYDFIND